MNTSIEDIQNVLTMLNNAKHDISRQYIMPLYQYEFIMKCLLDYEQLKKENEELKASILEWWKEHEYDTISSYEDEYNVYDEEPKFVTLAKESEK